MWHEKANFRNIISHKILTNLNHKLIKTSGKQFSLFSVFDIKILHFIFMFENKYLGWRKEEHSVSSFTNQSIYHARQNHFIKFKTHVSRHVIWLSYSDFWNTQFWIWFKEINESTITVIKCINCMLVVGSVCLGCPN